MWMWRELREKQEPNRTSNSPSLDFHPLFHKYSSKGPNDSMCWRLLSPLGVESVPFKAFWITVWASEFFFFKKSIVSRKSSSSVSWKVKGLWSCQKPQRKAKGKKIPVNWCISRLRFFYCTHLLLSSFSKVSETGCHVHQALFKGCY